MSAAMGMMHEGYFVGRKELIAWIQANFQANFQKIEDLGTGVVYCQIIDSIYPEVKVMAKVKRDAKIEVDFIHNLKELQKAFSKKKIDRYIDIDKLSKRSFQTNMEFVQFMKCYWDMHAPNGGGLPEGEAPLADHTAANDAAAAAPPPKKAAPAPKEASGPKRVPASTRGAAEVRPEAAGPSGGAASSAAQQQLALEVTELKMSVENLERERDFYYSKLREVEVLCQNNEGANVPFLDQVLEILYKTDDADEFISPEEAAVPVG